MGRITDLLFARRDAQPAPVAMVGFGLDGGLLPLGVNPTSALGLSAVWRCVDILANGVAQLSWRELRGANLELPPSRLVRRPQAERTRREWTSLVVSTLALYDVCYLYKAGGMDVEGVPMGLWPIDPTQVAPISTDYDPFMLPTSYYVGNRPTSADELVIIRRSPQPGIAENMSGVLKLARITFAAALAAESYASRYWQAGGAPTTVLETDSNLPPPVATEIADRWRERRMKGPDYAPVLTGGIKAREMGVDPTAQAAVEARREQVADIARYFGVPTRLVNAPTGDSQTYSSHESANQDLVRYTLQNYISAIEDAISEQLPGGRRMVMDTRKLTRGTQLAEAQAFQLATGGRAWMTPEEVRDDMGLPPVEELELEEVREREEMANGR